MISIDWTEQPYEYFSTMGCRTANGADINFTKDDYEKLLKAVIEGGKDNEICHPWTVSSKATKDGRGNISPVTIILPSVAMQVTSSKKTNNEDEILNEFLEILHTYIIESANILVCRYNYQSAQSSKSAKFMYQNNLMYGFDGKSVDTALCHGTLAIGILGLDEALRILFGYGIVKGHDIAEKILKFYFNKVTLLKEKYRLNFTTYATPAENLCFTACSKFKKDYGVTGIPEIDNKNYFTNSYHVPVSEKIDLFKKIDLEAPFHKYTQGGAIMYVEVDSSVKNNTSAIEKAIKYAMDKDVQYFGVNVKLDECHTCHYQGDIGNDVCPMCGGTDILRLRRVTGYLSGDYKSRFNKGKQSEVEDRVSHTGVEKEINVYD